jgi:TatD DNase family protein
LPFARSGTILVLDMFSPGLVDSHIHLTDFEPGTDVDALVAGAIEVGVTHMLCNGTSERDWPIVRRVAEDLLGVIPCFGLHPWFVVRRSSLWLSTLEEYIAENKCGVGEIGLDRCADVLDKDAQEDAFRCQLDLACKYDRPATIHCVRSWGWLMDVLRSRNELPRRMLIHAYGGPLDLVKELAEMGAYFSFSATVLNDNFKRARAALPAIPAERLLIETDAPNMLPPERFRVCRLPIINGYESNHPANLAAIADGIAGLLGEPNDVFREHLWSNSREFAGGLIKI